MCCGPSKPPRIRQLDEVAPNDQEPEAADFAGGGSTKFITVIAADGDHAVGAYSCDQSGTLGEGSILFSGTEGLTAEDALASFDLSKNEGLGLFLVPEGGTLDEQGIDLTEFSEGG